MLVAHAYPEHIVIVIIIFIVTIISLVLSYVEVMVRLQLIIIFSNVKGTVVGITSESPVSNYRMVCLIHKGTP